MKSLRRSLCAFFVLFALVHPALATWSVVVVNTRTNEVCIASATCLPQFALRDALAVVRTGVGAAACQSTIDTTGANRMLIWNGFIAGDSPTDMLAALAASDGGHQSRQYGIVDLFHDPVTFTGTIAGKAKIGVAGTSGDLRYSIQGNVLTAQQVVLDAEIALLNTPGDLGQKVMAAMEAARALGGDGRCSCNVGSPNSCGAPPPNFTNSSNTTFIVLARIGDTDGNCSSAGCANGNYYLNLAVIAKANEPDPVTDMEARYIDWRAVRQGRPDQLLSRVLPQAQSLVADGVDSTQVKIELVDLEGVPLTHGGHVIELSNVSGPGGSSAGNVVDRGDGTYTFRITAGTAPGLDVWQVRVRDGFRPVTLYPFVQMRIDPLTPLHVGRDQVSAAAGGVAPFTIHAGAGQRYLLLASASGTVPGTPFEGQTLPLNSDAFFQLSRQQKNTDLFTHTLGVLDANGRGQAAFAPPPGFLLSLAGGHLDWAAIVMGGGTASVVGPVGFDVTP